MSIVFVTKWSNEYEAPVIDVFANGRPECITQAIAFNKKMVFEDSNGQVIRDDAARKVSYANLLSITLKEDKYKLSSNEIDVIVDFIIHADNFKAFESLL